MHSSEGLVRIEFLIFRITFDSSGKTAALCHHAARGNAVRMRGSIGLRMLWEDVGFRRIGSTPEATSPLSIRPACPEACPENPDRSLRGPALVAGGHASNDR